MRALSLIAPWSGPITNGLTQLLVTPFTGLGKAGVSAVLSALGTAVSDGAASLLQQVAGAVDHVTQPQEMAPWFQDNYATMIRVALVLIVPLLLAAAIHAVLRQDPGVLLRAVFVQLPLAALGTGIAVTLVSELVSATDALSGMLLPGGKVSQLLMGFSGALGGLPAFTGGLFLQLLLALVVLFGGFLITIELVMRSAAVEVALLFLPIGLAGLVWPATARWAKRLIETLLVLIFSKFVIVAVLTLGIAALAAATTHASLAYLLTGAALLLLAAFAPYTLLKLIPMVEASAIAHLEGAGRRVLPAAVDQPSRLVLDRALANVREGGRPGEDPGSEEPRRVGAIDLRSASGDGGTGRVAESGWATEAAYAMPRAAGPAATAARVAESGVSHVAQAAELGAGEGWAAPREPSDG